MTRPISPPAPGNPLVFWMLILLGLITFAPCILLPEYRAYQSMLRTQAREQQKIQRMENTIEREKRLLDALQSDPAVIARIAQRELRFYYPSDRTVPVESVDSLGSDSASAPTNPDGPWTTPDAHWANSNPADAGPANAIPAWANGHDPWTNADLVWTNTDTSWPDADRFEDVEFPPLDVEERAITSAAPQVFPDEIQNALNRLPTWDYDALFCDPQTRPILMGLSVALIAAAMLIFSPRPQPGPR